MSGESGRAQSQLKCRSRFSVIECVEKTLQKMVDTQMCLENHAMLRQVDSNQPVSRAATSKKVHDSSEKRRPVCQLCAWILISANYTDEYTKFDAYARENYGIGNVEGTG